MRDQAGKVQISIFVDKGVVPVLDRLRPFVALAPLIDREERECEASLGVKVYGKHPLSAKCEFRRQVGRDRRLANATLVVDYGNGLHVVLKRMVAKVILSRLTFKVSRPL